MGAPTFYFAFNISALDVEEDENIHKRMHKHVKAYMNVFKACLQATF